MNMLHLYYHRSAICMFSSMNGNNVGVKG